MPSEAAPTGPDGATGDATSTDSGTARSTAARRRAAARPQLERHDGSGATGDSGAMTHDGGEDGGPDASAPVQVLRDHRGRGRHRASRSPSTRARPSASGAATARRLDADERRRRPEQHADRRQRDRPLRRDGHRPRHGGGLLRLPGRRHAHARLLRHRREVRDRRDGSDPMVPMAPFYFPLVYTTAVTTTGNAFGGQPPIVGLFDWRPKDIDEARRRGRVRRQRHDLVLHADGARAEPGLHQPDQRRLLGRARRTPGARPRSQHQRELRRRSTGRPPTTAGATRRSSSSRARATRRPGSSSTCSTATPRTSTGTTTPVVDNAPLHVITPHRGVATSSRSGTRTTPTPAPTTSSRSAAPLTNTRGRRAHAVVVQDRWASSTRTASWPCSRPRPPRPPARR